VLSGVVMVARLQQRGMAQRGGISLRRFLSDHCNFEPIRGFI
jgi:hypothetical protein